MLGNIDENFSIIQATNDNLRHACFRLRYEIFCLEKNILTKQNNSQIEQDEYDEHSIHFLLQYKPTQKYIGTVRLILGRSVGEKELPIEVIAKKYFYDVVDYQRLDRMNLAEISRLAIAPEFRPKFAVLGILRAVLQACIENNIDYAYAAVEPRVQRILQRIGIQFREISPVVTYHGQRQCYIGFIEEILAIVHATHPHIWGVLTDNGKICPRHIFCNTLENQPDEDDNSEIYNYR